MRSSSETGACDVWKRRAWKKPDEPAAGAYLRRRARASARVDGGLKARCAGMGRERVRATGRALERQLGGDDAHRRRRFAGLVGRELDDNGVEDEAEFLRLRREKGAAG